MDNLKALHDKFVENQSPAQELTAFIMRHSNSPEYLIGNLQAIMEAITADQEVNRNVMACLLRGLQAEKAEKKAAQ